MHAIDRYAYNNQIRWLHPAYKVGGSLVIMSLCLIINHPVFSMVSVALVFCLSVFWAGLPLRFLSVLLLGEAGFLTAGVLSVAISVSLSPVAGGLNLGPFCFVVTEASLQLAFSLLLRSLGCAAAMNFLALTTPMVDMVDLLRQLKVPDLLIDLLTLVYRFIFSLWDSLERLITASEVRLGFNGFHTSLRTLALVATNLFVETYRRSQRLQVALEGRGWDGTLRVLPQTYDHPGWKRKNRFNQRSI